MKCDCGECSKCKVREWRKATRRDTAEGEQRERDLRAGRIPQGAIEAASRRRASEAKDAMRSIFNLLAELVAVFIALSSKLEDIRREQAKQALLLKKIADGIGNPEDGDLPASPALLALADQCQGVRAHAEQALVELKNVLKEIQNGN